MLVFLLAAVLWTQGPSSDARLGTASREEHDGWMVLHLGGKPRDIGYQYGCLAGKEIDDAHKAVSVSLEMATGRKWSYFRDTAKKLFWDKLDLEYQDEIAGQAEGLKAKGYNYDQWDVLAFNSYIEIQLYYMPWSMRLNKSGARDSCSAFVATGSATRDGKIVIGQNLWWDYLTGSRFNTILDITPEHGNRLLMDALSGFIHSGSDFAINSAGLVITETTISGFFGFDPKGVPEFERMRKATQYANNLDDFVRIMKTGNNGGYANTWLIGDTKTNEIGKLELGLKNVTFTRKKDGDFVGANFPESPKLIAEEVPGGWSADPSSNGSENRRIRWETLLKQNTGAVDADKAESFLGDTFDQTHNRRGASNDTLCGRSDLDGSDAFGAVNAKVATSDQVSRMEFWARMGIPDGSEFKAKPFLQAHPLFGQTKAEMRDILPHPWSLIGVR